MEPLALFWDEGESLMAEVVPTANADAPSARSTSENPPDTSTEPDLEGVEDLLNSLTITGTQAQQPAVVFRDPVLDPRVLTFTLKREWFNIMERGEKRVEYRKVCRYWERRLFDEMGNPRIFDIVRFKNGYGQDVPEFSAFWRSTTREDNIDCVYVDGSRIQMQEAYCVKFDLIE